MAPKKKAKQPPRPPETADEYLAEAVSLEESAEKWRAGDAQKAARFYTRALNTYDEAIRLFPSSFDLSYNKSRIQYEITQRPAIRVQFPSSTIQLLQTALESHRKALSLEPNDADALFNTGQVLMSLAEAANEDASAAVLLREAVTLFERCLQRQEFLVQEWEAQKMEASQVLENEMPNQSEGGVSLNQSHPSPAASPAEPEDNVESGPSPEERWAAIVNPVTRTSLIETSIALLSSLTSLSALLLEPLELQTIEHQAQKLLDEKIPLYTEGLEDDKIQEELACESAKFRAASSEARFRFDLTDIDQYDQQLKVIFEPLLRFNDSSAAFLVCYADALVAFAGASSEIPGKAVLRYTRLSAALDMLTQASKSPGAKDLASIHMGRGDAEMLRYVLSNTGDLPANLSNDFVRQTLLKNAATYYRGAAGVAKAAPNDQENEVMMASLTKEALVNSVLAGDNSAIHQLQRVGISEENIQKTIIDMLDESLITQADLLRSKIT